MIRVLPLLALIIFAAAARAGDDPRAGLRPGGRAMVAAALDGDTVLLDDGRKVRLLGIQAPEGATTAAEALDRLLRGRAVALYFDGAERDRHGRTLAHLFLDDRWAQGEMVTRGLARVYTFADNATAAGALLIRERAARATKAGLWADPAYRVRRAEPPDDIAADTYQIVEGVVIDVARVRDWTYVNFGADWRIDFTAAIHKSATKAFDRLSSLKGKRVRVRGWVRSRNGPSIELDHPAQLERLE